MNFSGWTGSEDDQNRSLCGNHKDLRGLDFISLEGRRQRDFLGMDFLGGGQQQIKAKADSANCSPDCDTQMGTVRESFHCLHKEKVLVFEDHHPFQLLKDNTQITHEKQDFLCYVNNNQSWRDSKVLLLKIHPGNWAITRRWHDERIIHLTQLMSRKRVELVPKEYISGLN